METSGGDELRLWDRRKEENGQQRRKVGESTLLGSCPSPREQEAETQLDRIDEEIPKNSALNFQRSLKHKRVGASLWSRSDIRKSPQNLHILGATRLKD